MTKKINYNDKASPARDIYLLSECLWELTRTALWPFKRPGAKEMKFLFTLIRDRLKQSGNPYKEYLLMCSKALIHRRNAYIHEHAMFNSAREWFKLWEKPVGDTNPFVHGASKEVIYKPPQNELLANAILITSHELSADEFEYYCEEFSRKEAMEEILLFLACLALKNFNHSKKII